MQGPVIHKDDMQLPVKKPNFLIIGAAKAATTSLSNMLSEHPHAGIVQGKEPHFFSVDEIYGRGWEYYQSLYAHCHDAPAIGDASTSYSRIRYHPRTVSRILAHVPDVKIIYMVRHPVERMVSAYIERLGTPGTDQVFASINDAVLRQPMIIDSSRYWEVFDYYRRHFDESRIKIVWFEEFIADTPQVFGDVCRFLGIDDQVAVNICSDRQNSRENALQRMDKLGRGNLKVKTKWDRKTLRWVISQLRKDNRQFLRHFQKPLDYWHGL